MDKPLVTISMMTYNQEKYVRDSVRGILSQTYEPLQIVISDDCSRDKTWDIIIDEVDAYKAKGGSHTNIVLNRNDHNLGIVAHYDVVNKLKKGVLYVGNGGDDISLPNRVERIVEEWEKTGRTATIFHHGYQEIDTEGNHIRTMPPRSAECALGATAAYARKVFEFFPPLDHKKVTIEDQAWAKRAIMLGPQVRMDDVLLKYRVGCGVSTKFASERECLYKNAITMAQSCEQVLEDLDTYKLQISPERWREVYNIAKPLYDNCTDDWKIVSHISLKQRFLAVISKYRAGRLGRTPLHAYVFGITYLQPWCVGEFQRRVFYWMRNRLNRMACYVR